MAFVRLLSSADYGGKSHKVGTIIEVDPDTSKLLIGRGDAEAATQAEQDLPDVVRIPKPAPAADQPVDETAKAGGDGIETAKKRTAKKPAAPSS